MYGQFDAREISSANIATESIQTNSPAQRHLQNIYNVISQLDGYASNKKGRNKWTELSIFNYSMRIVTVSDVQAHFVDKPSRVMNTLTEYVTQNTLFINIFVMTNQ